MVFYRLKQFFLILFLMLGITCLYAYAQPVYAEQTVGQVVWVNGTMKALGADKKERTLKRKDFVYEHDTLSTGADSTGQVVFSDSSIMTFKENTVLKIDQYKYTDGKAHDQDKFVADLAKGGFRTITGAISKGKPENYKLATPVATIGVRGTVYEVAHTAEEGTSAGITQGSIHFANSAGGADLTPENYKFATIKSSFEPPKILTTQPPALANIPAITHVAPSPELTKAAGVSPQPVAAEIKQEQPAAQNKQEETNKNEANKETKEETKETKETKEENKENKDKKEKTKDEGKKDNKSATGAASGSSDSGSSGSSSSGSSGSSSSGSSSSGSSSSSSTDSTTSGTSSGSSTGGSKTVTSFTICPS